MHWTAYTSARSRYGLAISNMWLQARVVRRPIRLPSSPRQRANELRAYCLDPLAREFRAGLGFRARLGTEAVVERVLQHLFGERLDRQYAGPAERLGLAADLAAPDHGIDRKRRHAVLDRQHSAMQARRQDHVHARNQRLDLRRGAQARRVGVEPGVDLHRREAAPSSKVAEHPVRVLVRVALAVFGLCVDQRQADNGHLGLVRRYRHVRPRDYGAVALPQQSKWVPAVE